MSHASFTFHTPRRIVVEPGATARLGTHAAELLGTRCLLVTDPGIRRLGLLAPAIESLRLAGCTVTIFDHVEADPSVETLVSAVAAGRAASATGVLGVGGGSSLDVAKLAALLLGSPEGLDEVWGVNRARGPRLPLVLVPTTAGTGSEVTPVAIMTIDASEKRGVSSPILMPDLALLDFQLTMGLPPEHTAATGVDAMVHAIEAFTSLNANNNPLSRILAREALRRLGANIERAVFVAEDAAARSEMLLGAMLAGQAFANSPVAAVHALAYPIGSAFHVPHGLSNALVLPHVLRFNTPVCGPDYVELSREAFPNLGIETDLATAFEGLIKKLRMPSRLRDVQIPGAFLPELARAAMAQKRLLVNNPRPVTEGDALMIYRAAW